VPAGRAANGCPYTATTYRIDPRWPTRPSTITHYGGFPRSARRPDVPLRRQHADAVQVRVDDANHFAYTTLGNYIQSARAWIYDDAGNVSIAADYGAVADTMGQEPLNGDETWTYYTYATLGGYLLDKPSEVSTSGGNGQLTDVQYGYNASGHPTQVQTWIDNSNHYLTTTASYDSAGNLKTQTDGLNQTTTNRLRHDLQRIRHEGDASDAAVGVDGACRLGRAVRCAGKLTRIRTASRRARRSMRCAARPTRIARAAAGRTSRTTTRCSVRPSQYNAGQWPGSAVLSRGSSIYGSAPTSTAGGARSSRPGAAPSPASTSSMPSTRTTCAARSRPHTRPHYGSEVGYAYSYGYDLDDRQASESLAGNATRLGYGPNQTSRPIDGHTRLDHHDVHGRRTISCTLTGPLCNGDITIYAYDGRGNPSVTQQQIAHGAQWALSTETYDSMNRKTSVTTPDAGTRTFVYDDGNNLVDEYDGNGAQSHYTYDAIHRRTSKSWATASRRASMAARSTRRRRTPSRGPTMRCAPASSTSASWTSMTDASGTATYSYDRAGNLVQGGRSVGGTTYMFANSTTRRPPPRDDLPRRLDGRHRRATRSATTSRAAEVHPELHPRRAVRRRRDADLVLRRQRQQEPVPDRRRAR